MNTIFKNLSEFFTPENESSSSELQRAWPVDQSQSHTRETSDDGSRGTSIFNFPRSSKTKQFIERRVSKVAVGQFFNKVQSWFESSDEDDGFLAYSAEDVNYVPGFGVEIKKENESNVMIVRQENDRWEKRRWRDEVVREEDESRGLSRTKSFSEPPRGRKRSRSVEGK
ncbi:hypothetical protein GLAREA_02463 [Glarea lozoyensis ATCC 20868]|uniref:Uncharacterized protein n=1 Tax=Glarea lozoyensis (strain ATCC 20868 / MF5171) TaxID=1116229 RepID=S3CLB7_GLAL2|nr:uncharacterized protein GLAREA_02463 [Glarea lozoyensis ATCC 20868]EPE26550.1 hypothetical protein GLAREA_02463 [Glarea lozoyensis ATCC 20868]